MIETVTSSLENLGIQNFKSRSLLGFKSRLESILLVCCFMLSKAKERYGETLKYFFSTFLKSTSTAGIYKLMSIANYTK